MRSIRNWHDCTNSRAKGLFTSYCPKKKRSYIVGYLTKFLYARLTDLLESSGTEDSDTNLLKNAHIVESANQHTDENSLRYHLLKLWLFSHCNKLVILKLKKMLRIADLFESVSCPVSTNLRCKVIFLTCIQILAYDRPSMLQITKRCLRMPTLFKTSFFRF